MLMIMLDKLVLRKQRINDAMEGRSSRPASRDMVSDEVLAQRMGKNLKVIKHGN